jgi:hypothetical protein
MSNKKYLELVEETKPDGSQIGFWPTKRDWNTGEILDEETKPCDHQSNGTLYPVYACNKCWEFYRELECGNWTPLYIVPWTDKLSEDKPIDKWVEEKIELLEEYNIEWDFDETDKHIIALTTAVNQQWRILKKLLQSLNK